MDDLRARAHELVDALFDLEPTVAPGPALARSMEGHGELRRILDGLLVGTWPAFEASSTWALDGCSTPIAWVVGHTGAPRAEAGMVRRTAALARSMPHVSAAAAAGRLAMSHLRLLTRARTDEVAEAFDRDEEALVAAACTMSADQLAAHLERWRHAALAELERNDPDRHPDTDSEDDTATIVRGFQGRGILRADLTPASLALIIEAVEARIETWRRTGQLTEDDRTYQELVGAALVDLIADGSVSSRRGQLRPLLIVTATLAALFDRADVPEHERDQWRAEILGGGPIGKAALRRLVEQANVQLVVTDDDGEPLHVGRARRLATTALLVALLARSRGTCEFPGCAARHHRCHAHHITWWEDHGSTDIDNLVLICPSHHRLIHQRGFTVTRGPTGLEWKTPEGLPIRPPPFQAAA